MAKGTPWADRSGSERRRTLGGFALLYAAIALVALIAGWFPITVVFGLLAIGLAVGWFSIDEQSTGTAPAQDREKPAWMAAMDDPDAPDLSLPEYRNPRKSVEEAPSASPFDRPDTHPDTAATDSPMVTPPPADPPSPAV